MRRANGYGFTKGVLRSVGVTPPATRRRHLRSFPGWSRRRSGSSGAIERVRCGFLSEEWGAPRPRLLGCSNPYIESARNAIKGTFATNLLHGVQWFSTAFQGPGETPATCTGRSASKGHSFPRDWPLRRRERIASPHYKKAPETRIWLASRSKCNNFRRVARREGAASQ